MALWFPGPTEPAHWPSFLEKQFRWTIGPLRIPASATPGGLNRSWTCGCLAAWGGQDSQKPGAQPAANLGLPSERAAAQRSPHVQRNGSAENTRGLGRPVDGVGHGLHPWIPSRSWEQRAQHNVMTATSTSSSMMPSQGAGVTGIGCSVWRALTGSPSSRCEPAAGCRLQTRGAQADDTNQAPRTRAAGRRKQRRRTRRGSTLQTPSHHITSQALHWSPQF